MNATQRVPAPAVITQPMGFEGTPFRPVVFDRYSLRKAQAIVNARQFEQAAINLKFLAGDHWQDATGWVGPIAGDATDPVGEATLKAIEAAFVSRNAIAEITGRHVGGVMGRELHWKFTVSRPLEPVERVDEVTGETIVEDGQPDEGEQELIDEAETLLVEWWDRRNVPKTFKEALAAALNTKRGVLRIFVPPGMRDEQGNLPPGDLRQCLEYIWIEHLGSNEDTLELELPSATVYTDKKTRRQIGVMTYREQEDTPDQETVGGNGAGEERAELTYLASDGQTVLRVINQEGDVEEPLVLPLGGRLLMHELTRPWLVTPQIVSQQKLLNLSMTMKQRNAVVGGFLERIFLNVNWPGKWVGEGDNKRFVPEPVRVGPGHLTALQGNEVLDDKGDVVGVGTPNVLYRNPVSPDTFIATENSAYLAILQEANQLHYALAGDAAVSGESRKQARDAYERDLHLSGGAVETAVRWALETVLALAACLAGRAGDFDGLRAYVQARIDSGPVSAEDRRSTKEMVEGELLSRESGMSEIGVEDVDAEQQRIDKERARRASERRKEEAELPVARQAAEPTTGGSDQPGDGPGEGENS